MIPPPVDIEFFTPGGERGAHLLMVAALVPYKRVEVGIAVARELGLPLHIVGEGPLRRTLGLARRRASVRFLGRVSRERLRDEYRSAALLLVPNVEDFGMVTVEALACGTPVVGLEESGTADVVISGEHGELAGRGLGRRRSRAACRTVAGRQLRPDDAARARGELLAPALPPPLHLPAGARAAGARDAMIGEKLRINRTGLVAVDLVATYLALLPRLPPALQRRGRTRSPRACRRSSRTSRCSRSSP